MTLELYIKTLTGKTLTIHCESNDIVYELIRKISEKEGIPPEQQRLIFAGKEIFTGTDGSYSGAFDIVSELNIQNESTLHLILRLRGGGGFVMPIPTGDVLPKVLKKKCGCIWCTLSCLLCPIDCCINCCCADQFQSLECGDSCCTWCCYNVYCCKCGDQETEETVTVDWSEYKRMLHNIGWKKIPDSFNDIDKDKTNYWIMLNAVYNKTKNTPSRIRSVEHLEIALIGESVLCRRMRKFLNENIGNDDEYMRLN